MIQSRNGTTEIHVHLHDQNRLEVEVHPGVLTLLVGERAVDATILNLHGLTPEAMFDLADRIDEAAACLLRNGKVCRRCHRLGEPVQGDICGSCADDLRGEPTEVAAS